MQVLTMPVFAQSASGILRVALGYYYKSIFTVTCTFKHNNCEGFVSRYMNI
jgi:hypothetical protein